MTNLVVIPQEELVSVLRGLLRDGVNTTQPVKEVLNATEAAEFLDQHPKTLDKLIESEKLPVHYMSEREKRFLRSELIAWIASRPSSWSK